MALANCRLGKLAAVLVCASSGGSAMAAAIGADFAYQGRLTQAGEPYDGPADIAFSLWNAESAGGQIGSTITQLGVPVVDGLFAVTLDFGVGVFNGEERWLEITVNGSLLSPRQKVRGAPYAIQTRGLFVDDAGNVGIGTNDPSARLHVSGGDILADRGAATMDAVGSLTLGGAQRGFMDKFAGIGFENYDAAGVLLDDYVGAWIQSNNGEGTDSGDLRFATKSTTDSAAVERMLIDARGDVHIENDLDVTGNVSIESNLAVNEGVYVSEDLNVFGDAFVWPGAQAIDQTASLTLGGNRRGDSAEFATLNFQNYDVDGELLDHYVGAWVRSFNAGDTDSGDLRFGTKTRTDPSPVERMAISEAGNVGIGLSEPTSPLHVEASINGTEDEHESYVAHFHNTSPSITGGGPHVLALEVEVANPDNKVNYIQFFSKGDCKGSVEGNGGTGVTYATTGCDFAEALVRNDADETIEAGDVVGVYGGKISKRTHGAQWVMAVSTAPGFMGKSYGDDEELAAMSEKVAFVGQAPVKVRGPVAIGDYIVASGLEDGVAVAVPFQQINPEDGSIIVGRAWEASDDAEVKLINTVVGLPESASTVSALARTVRQQQAQIDRLNRRLDALASQLSAH